MQEKSLTHSSKFLLSQPKLKKALESKETSMTIDFQFGISWKWLLIWSRTRKSQTSTKNNPYLQWLLWGLVMVTKEGLVHTSSTISSLNNSQTFQWCSLMSSQEETPKTQTDQLKKSTKHFFADMKLSWTSELLVSLFKESKYLTTFKSMQRSMVRLLVSIRFYKPK